MRTTLDIDADVMELARSAAVGGRTSLGKAMSQLVRKGVTAQAPMGTRNGFSVFQVPENAPTFGASDIQAALDADDLAESRHYAGRQK